MSKFFWCWGRSTRADFRFAPSQWETTLLCNDVSHWLGTNLESALSMFGKSSRYLKAYEVSLSVPCLLMTLFFTWSRQQQSRHWLCKISTFLYSKGDDFNYLCNPRLKIWYSGDSKWMWVGINSDNGLAPNRRQAISWNNSDQVQRRI